MQPQQPLLINVTHTQAHTGTHTGIESLPEAGGTCQLFCTLLDPRYIRGVIGITTILRTTQFSSPCRAALELAALGAIGRGRKRDEMVALMKKWKTTEKGDDEERKSMMKERKGEKSKPGSLTTCGRRARPSAL